MCSPSDPAVAGDAVMVEEADGRLDSTDTIPAPDDFVSRVLEVVDSIPAGYVMSYGDVAATVGSRAARAVGTVMARYGSDVPWWRVIRASGEAPLCHDGRAREHYEAEGTPLVSTASGFRVDLRRARYLP